MTDRPPLLGRVILGRIVPTNDVGIDAIKACEGLHIRFEIKKSGANERRRGFYWKMLSVAAEALTDKTGDPWDSDLLHDELKIALKLGQEWTTPSGRKVFKKRSTSNRAMTEAERSHWTTRCANALSHWIGCEVEELMRESRARNGGVGPEPERKAA
jgi:hypothetical protein